MATIGNLELRTGQETLYASSTHDGDRAYEILPKLVNFLDSRENPTITQFQDWFKTKSKALLPYNHRKELLGGAPCEVIIDVPRKLVLHTAQDEFTTRFENACILLREKYNYEILPYTPPLIRNSQDTI
ncbi:MAG: hypothetical protein ABIH72_01955 [archaeon]